MKHEWQVCEQCGAHVRCGYCGNNCCNGSSGNDCTDRCVSAYAQQTAGWGQHDKFARTAVLAEVRELVEGLKRPHMEWCKKGQPETNPLASFHTAGCDCGAATYNYALDNVTGAREVSAPYHGYPAGLPQPTFHALTTLEARA